MQCVLKRVLQMQPPSGPASVQGLPVLPPHYPKGNRLAFSLESRIYLRLTLLTPLSDIFR